MSIDVFLLTVVYLIALVYQSIQHHRDWMRLSKEVGEAYDTLHRARAAERLNYDRLLTKNGWSE